MTETNFRGTKQNTDINYDVQQAGYIPKFLDTDIWTKGKCEDT